MTVTSMPLERRSRRGAALAAALLLPLPALAGDLYRWVDDDGDVHYSDAPPAEATRGRHATMRDDGTTREEIDPAERDQAAQGQGGEGDGDAAGRRDRVLLETYTSVDEIEQTRRRHLKSVEGEIGLAEHRLRRVRNRIEQYDRLLEELPEDSEYRPEMRRQRAEAKDKLEQRRETLQALQDKRERLEQRFREDIARFRELKSENGS